MTEIEQVFSLLEHDGVVRWFAKRRDGVRLGGAVRSPEDLERVGRASLRGADVYVQLNPAEGFRGMRAGVSDITHWRGFLLDLDPVPGLEGDMEEAMAVAVEQIAAALPQHDPDHMILSPVVVDSGRGMQAWFMGPTLVLSDGWREKIRRSTSELTKRLELPPYVVADPVVCDVSRVVRLPGTANQKTGRVARLLTMGQREQWPSFLSALFRLDPGEAEVGDGGGTPPESVDGYMDVWKSLTATAQAFITKGVSYPGRHTKLWHTADVLRREGLSKEAVFRALMLGVSACRPRLGEEDVRYAIQRAWEKKRLDFYNS